MLVALNTVRFRAVVSICGVNVTEWGLEKACGSDCYPFSSPIVKENHPLFAHFGDYTNRPLTPIDVFKGFTGVAYPMDILSRDLLSTIHKWRTLEILPIDNLRGFSTGSCLKSDDLVISAALHANGIRRYRITLNDDCREGLQQYEFGFKKDALQSEGGGHYKKYYTCIRAISAYHSTTPVVTKDALSCPVMETVMSASLAASQIPKKNVSFEDLKTERWPYLDYNPCISMVSQQGGMDSKKRDENGLAIRWAKDWRLKASKNSYLVKCWFETQIPKDAQWRCNFPPSTPEQDPYVYNTLSQMSIIPIQLAFPDDRIQGKILPKKRLFVKNKRKSRLKSIFDMFGFSLSQSTSNRRLQSIDIPAKNQSSKSKVSSKVSSKLRLDPPKPVKKDPNENPKRKGTINFKGGWDRIYAYADIYRGIFPRFGPLSGDPNSAKTLKNSSISGDQIGQSLNNEASNFFSVPYNTMKRFPKGLVGIVQQRMNAISRELGVRFKSSLELLEALDTTDKTSISVQGKSFSTRKYSYFDLIIIMYENFLLL
jgi:hypothetical protein